MYFYHAFGLTICSDIFIIEFSPTASTTSIDIEIKSGYLPASISEDPQQLLIKVSQIAQFLVTNGNRIVYRRETEIGEDTLRLFLLGSAMGALLQQRGHIVLHGNAISHDDQTCTVFVGNQGAGKSTTAAWHYQQGATILADDVSAIYFDDHNIPYVIPSYPQLKLWKSSTDLLDISTSNLRKLRQEYDKYALPLNKQFSAKPLPVTRIIELTERDEDSLSVTKKLDVLKTHSYRHHFIHRMQRTNQYAKQLLRLAQKVEILGRCRPVLHKGVEFESV